MTVLIVDGYLYELATPAGMVVGPFAGVMHGGRLEGNVDTQVRWGGQVTVRDPAPVDWGHNRLKVTYMRDQVVFPLGVFLVKPSTHAVDDAGMTVTYDLYDRTLIPAEDAVEHTYQVPAGTNVTTVVRQLLESTGEVGVSITPTTAVTRTAMVWEPGTSKLTIINELLDAAGFFALWADGNGQYRVEPYVRPSARPLKATYRGYGQYLPEYGIDVEATVPNRVVCVSQETGEDEAMISVALNENPASPYSFQAQGRWVTRTETGIEAATQAVLDEHAQRLLESGRATPVYERQVAPDPALHINDVVDGPSGREVVERVDMTLVPAALATVTTREVTT